MCAEEPRIPHPKGAGFWYGWKVGDWNGVPAVIGKLQKSGEGAVGEVEAI